MRGSQINWNQVYYFSQVAAAGSIKDAASQLGLSASTLSEHVSQLERDLAVVLFHRHHRRLELTDQGSRLFQYAKQMFETGQRLIDVVSPVTLGQYPISVAMVPSSSIQVGYRFLRRYIEKQSSSMKIYHSSHENLEKGLSEARFDFGFTDRPPERKNIAQKLLSASNIGFFVAKKFKDGTAQEMFAKLPLLVCNANPGVRSLAEQILQDTNIETSATISADYPSMLIDLCKSGLGIAVFSQDAVEGETSLSQLSLPRGAIKLPHRLYVLWSRDSENSEAVKRLQERLKEFD